MGRSGPKSNAPGGYGSISPKGYRRVWDVKEQRFRMEHVLVWEQHNGSIPRKMQVHHRDGNKLNNVIENLELLDSLTHKRLHSGCEMRNGEWWKPCRRCGEFFPASLYYQRESGIASWCRQCSITNAMENKRKRKRDA